MCSKDFKTLMELVNHVAREHHKEEEAWNTQLKSTPKEDKEGKLSNFVFSESMLDKFLV